MSTLDFQFHPQAQQDLRAAARCYDIEEPGLGDEVTAAIERAVMSVVERSRTWPAWPKMSTTPQVRRRLVKRFPFAVGYVVRKTDVVVVVIAHTRRRPGYWLDRLGKLPPPP